MYWGSFTTFQELYVRQGITPKYDLVQIEGAVHEPTFKYRVTVGDAVATGNIIHIISSFIET